MLVQGQKKRGCSVSHRPLVLCHASGWACLKLHNAPKWASVSPSSSFFVKKKTSKRVSGGPQNKPRWSRSQNLPRNLPRTLPASPACRKRSSRWQRPQSAGARTRRASMRSSGPSKAAARRDLRAPGRRKENKHEKNGKLASRRYRFFCERERESATPQTF